MSGWVSVSRSLLPLRSRGAVGPPPWASKLHHHHEFPSAEEVVGSLDLDDRAWERVRVEAAGRQATGPEGQVGTLVDNVIILRRRA